jgi:mono/diheme cytochrome c family protein
MRTLTRILVWALILLPLAAAAAIVGIYSGLYDVAATRQHTAPVYWALITSLRQSIKTHAARESPPPPPELYDAAFAAEGLVLYEEYCLPCHGAPGVAPHPIGKGLTPLPANLLPAARTWSPGEIHWVVKNGLKMTGMPAWEFRMTEREIWSVVAFVRSMRALAPWEYERQRAALVGVPPDDPPLPGPTGGEATP